MARIGWLARAMKGALYLWFRLNGWTVEGSAPSSRKFVIIAAPHTSNWDFVYFLGGARALNLNLSFMGKASLFRGMFGKTMRELGGIPVDRSKSNNAVAAMAAEFNERDEFMLTIAPEGARGRASEWKSGFYQIAMAAGVPMVCGMMDYKRKVVALGEAIMPTGDYAADMVRISECYRSCSPKYPQRATAL